MAIRTTDVHESQENQYENESERLLKHSHSTSNTPIANLTRHFERKKFFAVVPSIFNLTRHFERKKFVAMVPSYHEPGMCKKPSTGSTTSPLYTFMPTWTSLTGTTDPLVPEIIASPGKQTASQSMLYPCM